MLWFLTRFTGKTTRALNMSSYNYLGFVEPEGPCLKPVEQSVRDCGVGVCSGRHELGKFEFCQKFLPVGMYIL